MEAQSRLLRQVADRVNTLICVVSSDKRFIAVNHYWETVLEWTQEEMLSFSFGELLHPDDIKSTSNAFRATLNGAEASNYRNRFRHKQGHYVWLSWSVSPYTENNEIIVYASAQVVTDLVDLENQMTEKDKQVTLLSHVAQTALTGVVICDAEKKVIWTNEAFSRITEYSFEDVAGKFLGPILQGPDTSRSAIEFMRKKLKAQENINIEILNYTKNNKTYWNHLLISPVFQNNSIINYIGIQTDVTERRAQQEAVLRSQKMQALGQLSAGICHDFNNIIAIISGNTQLLRLTNQQNNLDKFITNLENATERATNATKRLLKIVKNEETRLERVKIDNEIRNTLTLFSESVPETIRLQATLRANITVKCNKSELLDALLNILINARNAIEEDGAITVETRMMQHFDYAFGVVITAPEKHYDSFVLISIADTGKGIPAKNIKKIFEPFFTTRSDKTGMGLGLSLVYDYAVECDVGIQVSSEEQLGTIFNLWLPVL